MKIVYHICWAIYTFLGVIVEVFRNIAGNAGHIIPEGTFLTFTNTQISIIDLSTSTSITLLGGNIPEISLRTCHTFDSIEDWSLERTIHTLLLDNVIDLILWAVCTLQALVIKVFRMIAFDACHSIEKCIS